MITTTEGRLAVLLATYNGDRFLSQQLRSVADQRWQKIDVYISDDGSTDKTSEIAQFWSGAWQKGQFRITGGPGRGFAENFRSLLRQPINADYMAFCDQDDIWEPEKTRAAVAELVKFGSRPALYCARTRVVDDRDVFLRLSPKFEARPTFANALVQNIGGGNTMVMNHAAHELLREAASRTSFVAHDWFAYMMVSGAGGHVIYSPVPHVHYRQHDSNLVGANTGAPARLKRIGMTLQGRFARWNEQNIAALESCSDLLTPSALGVLERFRDARQGPMPRRLVNLWRSGAHRQTALGQVSLYAAGVMGKL